MTDLDDRVRTLLETRARDVAVNPEMPRTVGARSKRCRAAVGTAVGVVTVAALVVGAAAMETLRSEDRFGDDPTPTIAPSATPQTPTPPVSPSPSAPPVTTVPDSFVGVRDGEIVIVDTMSGEMRGVLVERAALGGGAGAVDLELSPDGTTAYYVAAGDPELIMSVPIEGGEPTLVANGRRPTLSPDGGKLAYVDCDSPMGGCGDAVRVLDLGAGTTRTWSVEGDEWVGSMAWFPDSRTLGYSLFYPGDSNPTAHVLDTVADVAVALGDIEAIGPERAEAGWTVVGFHRPTGGLAVLHYCCSSHATDELEETGLLSVGADGRVIETLLDRADWSDVDLDASGGHVLLVDLGGDVYRLAASGEPVLVASGYEHVAW